MGIKSKILSYKQFGIDVLYTVGAQILLNGVLQLFIYPYINLKSGSSIFGSMVFYMEIITVIGMTLGVSLCNVRITTLKKFKTTNYDYNFLLKLAIPIGAVIAFVFVLFRQHNIYRSVLFAVVTSLTLVRYYVSVEYRIHLNYIKYFFYFVVLTIGYSIGAIVYTFTNEWMHIFLVGEAIVVLYMAVMTPIFKKEESSGNLAALSKNYMLLSISYLITEVLNNLDKLIIEPIIGADTLAVYYVISLIGKTMLLFSAPLGNVLLSYMANDEKDFKFTTFKRILYLLIVVDAVFYLACIVGTPIYVKLFYPDMANQINGLNYIVNAAQIVTFTSSLFLIILLGALGSKYHLILQTAYFIVVLPLSILLTVKYNVVGFAIASLVSNIIRCAMIIVIGYKKLS